MLNPALRVPDLPGCAGFLFSKTGGTGGFLEFFAVICPDIYL
jgi:hypothetical protein